MIKVGLVSLGCAKNLIDSEIMIGHLQQAGMVMTPEPDLADVLIVNTCSFIDMAKKESIGAVHDAVDQREGSKKTCAAKDHRRRLPLAAFFPGTAGPDAGGGCLHRP
jgi:ribosomal protein S12 methylthiotransferase